MAWQQGPMPKNTYGCGGAVPFDSKGTGFYFADFYGDHVKLLPGDRILQAHEVAWYDNSIELPPISHHGEGASRHGSGTRADI